MHLLFYNIRKADSYNDIVIFTAQRYIIRRRSVFNLVEIISCHTKAIIYQIYYNNIERLMIYKHLIQHAFIERD